MSAPAAPYDLMLADDGIIDLLAVEIAARGTRPVALTRAERHLAAAAILARGGTPDLISKRLHVSGSTALTLTARCQASRRVSAHAIRAAADNRRELPAPPQTRPLPTPAAGSDAGPPPAPHPASERTPPP